MKPLLLAFGACPMDAAKAALIAVRIAEITPPTPDEALVTATPLVSKEEHEAIMAPLRKVFSKVHARTLSKEISGPKWLPQNYMFQNVIQSIRFGMTHVAGFYVFEPDCVPLKPDWWQVLSAEYRQCGKPFMGVLRKTFVRDASVLGGKRLVGSHINGACWYPQDCVAVVPSLALDCLDNPWDAHCGASVVPKSHLSKHMWVDLTKDTWTKKDLAELPPDVRVVHGDKDGSLLKLVSGKSSLVSGKSSLVSGKTTTAEAKSEGPPKKRRARRKPGWAPLDTA